MKSIFEFAHALGLRGKQATDAADLIEARDAEHRAELDAAQRTIEQLGKDAAVMAAKLDRAVELFKSLPGFHSARGDEIPALSAWFEKACAFLAPPPAESTPARFTQQDADALAEEMNEAAPPDDIRERPEESLINRIAEAKSYVLGQAGRVERVFAAHSEEAYRRLADHERRLAETRRELDGLCEWMKAAETRIAALDSAVQRRWGDYAGQLKYDTALEAKGEPPTCYMTACRYYGQRHATPHEPGDDEAKGAKP